MSYVWTSPVQTRISLCRPVCPSAAPLVASCSYSLPVNRNTGWHCHNTHSTRLSAARQPSVMANAKSRRTADTEQVQESGVDHDQHSNTESVSEAAPKKAGRPRKVKASETESAEEASQESTDAPAKQPRKPRAAKTLDDAALEIETEETTEAAAAYPADLELEPSMQQQGQQGSSSSTAEYDEQEQEQDEGEVEEAEEGEYSLAAYSSAEDGGEGDEEEYEEGEYDAEITAEDDDDSAVDIYEQFYGGKAYFPRHLLPKNEEERQQMLFQLSRESFLVRQNNSWEVEDLAWESHHHQNRVGVNKYANVRRIAGMMSVFENDDYQLGPNQPGNLSSWARSEIVFREEFDEFNTYIDANMESIVKQATEEEKQEDADFLEDVMMEPQLADDRVERKFLTDAEQEDMMTSMFLEGILPNVSLSSTSQQFADDIFVADDSMLFEDDVLERDNAKNAAAPKASSSTSKEDGNQGSMDGADQDEEQDFAEQRGEQGEGGDYEQGMGQGGEEEGDRPGDEMSDVSDTEEQN